MNRLHIHRAVYLGDTIDDMKAAVAAHIIPIGIVGNDDVNDVQTKRLQQWGADYVLKNVNEIVELLK